MTPAFLGPHRCREKLSQVPWETCETAGLHAEPRKSSTQVLTTSLRFASYRPSLAAGAAIFALSVGLHGAPLHELPALSGTWLERLGNSERGAVLTLPLGAREPRPLVIGVHGAGDRPEWSCGGWRLAAHTRAFVLCPRGSKLDGERFAWTSSKAIERALDDGLAELRHRYARYLDSGPRIYAGFSQGATLAEPILRARGGELPIAILAEGGYQTAQSPNFARAYRAAGGRRVVLVCGSRTCFSSAARARPILERAGLEVLLVGDERAGHNLNERMQAALQRAWPAISAPLSRVLTSP